MSLNIQSDFFSPARIHTAYGNVYGHSRENESAPPDAAAFVNNISRTAVEKLKENLSDAPLSDTELDQLLSVYSALEDDQPLWKDISTLLSGFSGSDRANFISVLSKAGSNLKAFVNQVKGLSEDDRSVYLRTTVRTETEKDLGNLINAVKNLSEEHRTDFFNMADALGRSSESVKAQELRHFIAAAAASPLLIHDLTQATAGLFEEDRAAFLKTAAHSGNELKRLIDTKDMFSGSTLTLFLTSAARAGKGLTNLLDLTGEMTSGKRHELLNFAANLSDTDTENFFLASRGLVKRIPRLMETARSFTGDDKSMFLNLASSDEKTYDRLMTIIAGLDSGTGERSDFLRSGLRAGDKFDAVLDLAQMTAGRERANLFSFTADLSLADMTNFFSALQGDLSQAHELAATAEQLEGKNKSYLLYAASLSPENIPELITISRELTGAEQDDFLFISANIDPETDGAMDRFLSTAGKLKGTERANFLDRERAGKTSDGRYVYLKSVFDEDTFQGFIDAGGTIDELITDFENLDSFQQTTFLTVASKTEKEMIPELLSVMARLDEDESRNFTDFADGLDKTGVSDLIRVADQVLDGSDAGRKKFSRMLEITKDLDGGLGQKFLGVSARAGSDIDRLIDLTGQLGGTKKVNFLVAAEYVAHRTDEGKYLENFFRGTEFYLNAMKKGVVTSNDTSDGIRPSQLITDTAIKGYSSTNLKFYLESAASIRKKGISDEVRADWYRTW